MIATGLLGMSVRLSNDIAADAGGEFGEIASVFVPDGSKTPIYTVLVGDRLHELVADSFALVLEDEGEEQDEEPEAESTENSDTLG